MLSPSKYKRGGVPTMTTHHGYPEPKGPLTLSPSKYARGVPAMTTHHGYPEPKGPLTLSPRGRSLCRRWNIRLWRIR